MIDFIGFLYIRRKQQLKPPTKKHFSNYNRKWRICLRLIRIKGGKNDDPSALKDATRSSVNSLEPFISQLMYFKQAETARVRVCVFRLPSLKKDLIHWPLVACLLLLSFTIWHLQRVSKKSIRCHGSITSSIQPLAYWQNTVWTVYYAAAAA